MNAGKVRRRAALAATAAAVAAMPLLAAGSASAGTGPMMIGHCRAQGDYATCVAGGTVYYPATITIYAWASRSQHLTVYWDETCGKGFGAGGRSGHFTGWAGHVMHRRIPLVYYRPHDCIVSADSQLNTYGHLGVWIKRTQY